MPNKKDLEQEFSISDNTVYKTLKSCGLNTAKEDYSDEEIEIFFRPARQMLDAGKKYDDVKERFQTSDKSDDRSQYNDFQATITSDVLGIPTAEMAADLVTSAVKQISPYIPQLIAHTLAEEMQSPQMKKAFEETRLQIVQKNNNVRNVGADFLLQKMRGTSQLTGNSPNQAQLPEAL